MTTTMPPTRSGHRAPRHFRPGSRPRRRFTYRSSHTDHGAGRSPSRSRGRYRRFMPYLFLLPAATVELLILAVPMAIGMAMSVLRLTEFSVRTWTRAPGAGLANYRLALDFRAPVGAALLRSFWITIQFTVLSVGLAWAFGLAAAVLLSGVRRNRILTALFLTPYALPLYAGVLTWSFLFQRKDGLVNHLLGDDLHLVGTGRAAPFWLIGGHSFTALVIVSVWRTWPFAFLILTAGLAGVSRELYEAAEMDGAGWLRSHLHVTIPALSPVTRVLVLVLFLWTFNDFNTPYLLFGGSPPPGADLVAVHIYQGAFLTWNFGEGTAMSVLLMLFLLFGTMIYLMVTRTGRDSQVRP